MENGSLSLLPKKKYEKNKVHKKLRRLVGKALMDFNMLEDGDTVMVCLSGGKTPIRCWTYCSVFNSTRR